MRKTLTLAAMLAAALFGVAGCGGNATDSDAGDSNGASSQAPAKFNDADIAFAQGMIPHHRQAVEMAEMAEERSSSPKVEQLATDIEAAQAPEIEQLTQWLNQWDADVPKGDMGHRGGSGDMGHGDGSGDMSGMMSEQDMSMLEDATGRKFDRMFLTMMIEHHRGAVEMAQREVEAGQHSGAIRMAKEIIATQQDEIDQMQALLKQ